MTTLLLKTKFHAPAVPADLVPRTKVYEHLDRWARRPLALVSAPAGYGKSTTIAHWLQSLEEPTAWVSLDESDSDLRVFLEYMVAAIDSAYPAGCADTASLLQATELPAVSVLAASLINELDMLDEPLTLVLDDYHRIGDPAVHELVGEVLRHPPLLLHLVLVTRRDPPLSLTALRAGGALTDVRLADLGFTDSETELFLERATGVRASTAALANVQQVLEGWAAGLRLLALVLRHHRDPEQFLVDMKGRSPLAQDYLLQEVLDWRSPEEREWLLKASILDRFSPELCEAVCAGGDESKDGTVLDGRAFISLLEHTGLFVIPLDAVGDWFRYHHLFQNLLAHQAELRFGRDGMAGLHVAAGEWFEAEGLIDEALEHFVVAGEVERAAQLVERHRQAVLNSDRWYVLERWLALLPGTVVQQRAELLLVRAWMFLRRLRIEAMIPAVDQAESLLAGNSVQQQLREEIALFRGFVLFFQGDGAQAVKLLEQALEGMPDSAYEARSEADTMLSLANQMEGRKEQALRRLDELVSCHHSPRDLRGVRLLAIYVFVELVAGDLLAAEKSNRRLSDAVAESGHAHVGAWAVYLQGLIHLYRYDLDAAVEQLGRSVAQRFIHHKRAAVDSLAGLTLAYQALGRADEAQATLQLLRQYADSLADPAYSVLAASVEARLAMLQGRAHGAVSWLESCEPLPPEVAIFWLEVPCVTLCRALISKGSPASLAEAEQRLREYAEMNEGHHNTCQLIGTLCLLAIACDKQGKTNEARTVLQRAVTLAEPGGFVFPFLELGAPMAGLLRQLPGSVAPDHVGKLLAAFEPESLGAVAVAAAAPPAVHKKRGAPFGIDSLTNREMDVLELLAQRLYNKEIAVKLSVSTDTVKAHLKSIYRKLEVDTRRQAAMRAEELGVVTPDHV